MRRTYHRGFTLVELLVVIGIVALLISILLPAMNKARQAAMAVNCASNQRQLLVGLRMYAEEHDGWFPPVEPLFASVTVDGTTRTNVRAPWWSSLLVGAYINNRSVGPTAFSEPQQRPTTDVVYCPAVRPQPRHNHDTGIGYNNSRQNNFNRKLTGTLRKLGTFRQSYKVIMLVDTESVNRITFSWERYYWEQGYPISGNDNPGRGYVAYRHGGVANVGFADGHVQAFVSDHPNNPSDQSSGLWKAFENKEVTHRAGN